MPLCVADHKSQGILPTEEPRNRVVQVKRFGTVLPRPASSRADALSRSARRRRVRLLAFGYQNHVSIDRRSASSANGRPQTRLPMRAVVCARLARQQQYGERGVGRYRLPIGGQRDVPKQEGIARATTMIGWLISSTNQTLYLPAQDRRMTGLCYASRPIRLVTQLQSPLRSMPHRLMAEIWCARETETRRSALRSSGVATNLSQHRFRPITSGQHPSVVTKHD